MMKISLKKWENDQTVLRTTVYMVSNLVNFVFVCLVGFGFE